MKEPGNADVTADVDFKNLKKVLEADQKLLTFGPIDQGTFLLKMEASVRLQQLLESSSNEEKENLKSSFDMLISPDKMGQRFKFLSFFPMVLKSHLNKFPVSGF